MKGYGFALRLLPLLLALLICLSACGAEEPAAPVEPVIPETAVPAEPAPVPAEESSEESAELPEQEPEAGLRAGEDNPGQYILEWDERDAFAAALEETTSIPTLCIYTEFNASVTSLTDYVPCIVDTVNFGDTAELQDSAAGIRVRGNSTAYYGNYWKILANQVPYRIKFEKKTSLFGLNDGAKCKSWVLLVEDWQYARADLTMRLGRAFLRGDAYCSDGMLVHVYLNQKFAGVYELCEQNQVNKHRVNIPEPAEDERGQYTGYYVELDNYSEAPCVAVDYNGGAEITDYAGVTRSVPPADYSVKSELRSEKQKNFLCRYLNAVYKVLYFACEKGEYYALDEDAVLVPSEAQSAKEAVSAVIDLNSAVDMYLLHELLMSYDCGEGSFYFSVDLSGGVANGRLTFTTPWDFNWTAATDHPTEYFAGMFRDDEFVKKMGERSNPWFILLLNQDWFRKEASDRLQSLMADGTVARCLAEERACIHAYWSDLSVVSEDRAYGALNIVQLFEDRINWLADRLLADTAE